MNKILTLDTSGYVSDPPLIVDRVMRNFFVANYTQTNVHWGQIHSLPHLIAKFAEDMYGLSDAISSALESMLSGYFSSVLVDVTLEDIVENEPQQNIKIVATVYMDGAAFDVGKLLTLVKNRISKIENI